MKFLKTIGTFLLFVIGVATIVIFVAPVKQTVKRDIIINAERSQVFQYLSKLENFNRWSTWTNEDSSIKNSITGKDGQVGAYNTWQGDPYLSGSGTMSITSLAQDQKLTEHISFITPKKMEADSKFDLVAVTGGTKVSWEFIVHTPRPSNIFNLFSSLDREKGKDFEKGLYNLKTAIEQSLHKSPSQDYNVEQINFPATTYAMIKQLVQWKDIPSFVNTSSSVLDSELLSENNHDARRAKLFYSWDQANLQTEMGVAILVPAGQKINNPIIETTDLPASKAISINYPGSETDIALVLPILDHYLVQNNLKQKMPMIWKPNGKGTTIIYLVE